MQLREAYRAAIEYLVRPYVRHELPAWGPIYKHLVGSSNMDHIWRDAGKRTFKDKVHGFEIQLDLATWSERISYFLGRYYDLPTQLLLNRALRPGDHAYDVGANVGHLSFLMARRVGENGRVDAFEPNPIMLDRIRATVDRNRIRNLFLHGYGLSSEEKELELHVPKVSPGETTFTPTPYAASEVDTIRASVRRGDTVAKEIGPPNLIKIDVEGFECNVIDGLAGTLSEHRPLVITEVMVEHLGRVGETAASLFDRMRRHGYLPRRLGIRSRARRHELLLEPVTPEQIHYADVVWFDPKKPDHLDRLQLQA